MMVRELEAITLKILKNFEDILARSLKDIMKRKYNGWSVYLHNFSRFDAIFLINVIVSISDKIKVLKRESEILNINLRFGRKNQYSVNFRDSYLLFPVRLRELCEHFKILEKKDFFSSKICFWR